MEKFYIFMARNVKSVLQYPSHPRMDVFKSLINANVETFEKCCIDIDII